MTNNENTAYGKWQYAAKLCLEREPNFQYNH